MSGERGWGGRGGGDTTIGRASRERNELSQTLVVLGTGIPPLEISSYSKASAETEAILFNLEIRFTIQTS